MGIADFIFGKPVKPTSPTKYLPQAQEANENAAQTGIDINSLDRTGPFGSSQFQRDAQGNVTGINNQFMGGLAGGVGNVMGAFGAQAGMLPTGAFNPNTNGDAIRQAYMDRGLQGVQGQWDREDDAWKTTLAERGLAYGDEIDRKHSGQVGDQRNQFMSQLADQAYLAGTGEEQRQYQNQLTEYQLPQQMAMGGLGLLGGANSLLPQAQQYTQGVNPVDVVGAYQGYDAAKMKAQGDQNAAMSGLFQAGGTILGGGLFGNKKS
jgi:hypothetical protein